MVSRASQKKIMVGKGGSMIKAIGTAARLKLQKLLEAKVRGSGIYHSILQALYILLTYYLHAVSI